MRGNKILNEVVQANMFDDADPIIEKKRGRSEELLTVRNRRIAARLYYYRTYHYMLKNEVIMELMQQDFDLSIIRLVEILEELVTELRRLRNINPDLEWFAKRWPRLIWSVDMPKLDADADEEF